MVGNYDNQAVEKLLANEKERIESLEAPEELNDRLRKALYQKKSKKKISQGLIAAGLVAFLLITSHYNVIAYYGKKIMGYDVIMGDTLQKLNEVGRGQEIGKSYRFKNGVEVTLDGIMLDSNNLLAFYTIRDEKGEVEEKNLQITLIGFSGKRYYMESGRGEINENTTEVKWLGEFQTPNFLTKTLKFQMTLMEGKFREEGEIKFPLDWNKAMGYSLKNKLNQEIDISGNTVYLKELIATPTSTVIKGKIDTALEYIFNRLSDNKLFIRGVEMDLIANGKKIPLLGGSLSTNVEGITFEQEYDALPSELQDLKIQFNKLTVRERVKSSVNISPDIKDHEFTINDQKVCIKKVEVRGTNTHITMETEDHVGLYKPLLTYEGGTAPFEKVVPGKEIKKTDGTIMYKREFIFQGTGENMKLQIGEIIYSKIANKAMQIPLQ